MTQDKPSLQQELGRLSPGDQKAFAWLGTLHQEAIVRPATVTVLWSLPEAEAHEQLQRLQEAGLVQTAGEEGYRLDSTMHEKAWQLLSERMALPKAHARLLEGYRAQTRNGLWHTLPDDGYILQHLTWHMLQAGWEDEIHAPLKEETSGGRNGWYETRLHQGQSAGYQQDVARARQLADEKGDVGLQCRYVLLIVSTSSFHNGKLLALLDRLVETGPGPRHRDWPTSVGSPLNGSGRMPWSNWPPSCPSHPMLMRWLPHRKLRMRALVYGCCHTWRTDFQCRPRGRFSTRFWVQPKRSSTGRPA